MHGLQTKKGQGSLKQICNKTTEEDFDLEMQNWNKNCGDVNDKNARIDCMPFVFGHYSFPKIHIQSIT